MTTTESPFFEELTPAFLREASDIVEALYNLNYLICEDANNPAKIRQYANLSEERLSAMIQLFHRFYG